MSTPRSAEPSASHPSRPRTTPQRVTVVRAVLALAWAAALVLAVGDDVPTTASDVPTAAALLLATYPAIDAVASIVGAALRGAAGGLLRINAAISAVAVVAVGAAAFGSDAGATLAAFGVWAAVSGALQLAVALRRRSAEGRPVSMLVSGGLSTLAGLMFLMASANSDAHLATLAGYMALGAILFLVSARGGLTSRRAAR